MSELNNNEEQKALRRLMWEIHVFTDGPGYTMPDDVRAAMRLLAPYAGLALYGSTYSQLSKEFAE